MFILYAEDDPDDLMVFCEAILTIDPKILCQSVTDGSEVFQFLENAVVLPHLIFLDINMPVMNGKDCLIRLKNHDEFKSIPVVMYTTSNRAVDRQQMLKLGAVDYIEKPNSFSELVKILDRTISLLAR